MIIHANATREDFIEFLYRACQDANMPAQVLDCVEDLREATDIERRLAEVEDELDEMEHDRDDLLEELASLCAVLDNVEAADHLHADASRALAIAKKAIERHSK